MDGGESGRLKVTDDSTEMTNRSDNIIKLKNSAKSSSKAPIFRVDNGVLLFQTEFQTKPLTNLTCFYTSSKQYWTKLKLHKMARGSV